MTNREMIRNYNGLYEIQEKESEYQKRTGKKLFMGRMSVLYAIKKNMETLSGKMKPYNDARDEIFREYRDLEKEQEAIERLKVEVVKSEPGTEKYQKEMEEYSRRVNTIEIKMKEEKSMEEYVEKLNELLDIEVEDVPIHKISPKELDGVEFDSADLEPLMFMLKE